MAAKILEREDGVHVSLINARFIKPLDEQMLCGAAGESDLLVILEEAVEHGSYGEAVAYHMQKKCANTAFLHICIESEIVPHGTVAALRKRLGLDVDSVVDRIRKELKK